MEKSKYFLLISLTVFASCGMFTAQDPDMKEAGRISHGFVKEVSENYPYEVFGMGGAFCGAINGFLIEFQTYQEISETQAEQDIRDIYNRLISNINADEKIRPFLVDWPFPGNETDVGIMFFDPLTNKCRLPPQLAAISIKNGKIFKSVKNPERGNFMSPEEYEQKFERKFNEEPNQPVLE